MKKYLLPVVSVVIFVFLAFILFKGNLQATAPSEKTIPLDPSLFPQKVVIDSLHHRAYIAAHTSVDTVAMPVTVFDTLHDSIVSVLPVHTLGGLAVNTRTNRLYIADTISNTIAVFNTETNTQVSSIAATTMSPVALAVNDTTNTLYILGSSNATSKAGLLSVVDLNTGKFTIENMSVGTSPTAIAVDTLHNSIYVMSSENDPGLTVVDGKTNTIKTRLPIGTGLTDIAVDTVLQKIYMTNGGKEIFVVDGVTNTVQPSISLTNAITCAHTLSIDVVTHKLYAACFTGLTVFDTKKNTLVQQMPLTGELPITQAISSQYFDMDVITGKIYVPLEETHQLAVVTFHASASIDVPKEITGNEGSTVSIPLSFTDTDSTSWILDVDYGDGVHDHISPLTTNTLKLQHVYKDNGIYMVAITVTDAEESDATATIPVTIWDTFPTVGAITVSDKVIPVHTTLQATALFTDSGKDDTHTAKWNWGDGIISNGTITGQNTSGSVTGSHLYSLPGVYKITVTVEDKDSGATTNNLYYVIVYDPLVPFMSGTGVFDSPIGSYTPDAKVTGKVAIGFSIKNTGTPYSGNIFYTFRFAKNEFHATHIDSLIKTGTLTRITGSGVINNDGSPSFLLVIQDNKQLGTPDTIRVKIWDAATGVTLYDTQLHDPDTALPTTLVTEDTLLLQ